MEIFTEQREIERQFARQKKRQWVASGVMILGIIAFAVNRDPSTEGIFGLPRAVILAGAFSLAVAALIFTLLNWRCPACNKYLGKSFSPTFCSKCGAKLQ